jgi:hypothetical protein
MEGHTTNFTVVVAFIVSKLPEGDTREDFKSLV